jgi:hypothetical protein
MLQHQEVPVNRRIGFWMAASALFALANAVAAGFYYARGEVPHSFAHAGLMVLATWLVWWFAAPDPDQEQSALPPGDQRLERLQQSVDAVAVELERFGEAQRYKSKLEAERGESRR